MIGVQLLTSIEKTFNEIWGVRGGRGWGHRVVFYWTFISLGAVLGIGSVTLLSASALAGVFQYLPFGMGERLAGLVFWAAPLASFAALVFVLMSFYQFFPHTKVAWRPALAGAFLAAGLLILNNYASFIYIHRVITHKSLYGSLGIWPVLMIGLYIFWLIILLGGQLTYALQNVNCLTTQEAWNNISPRTREALHFAALLCAARRFHECRPPCAAADLARQFRVPENLLNECLGKLCELGWIAPVAAAEGEDGREIRYQPARPLNRIYLPEVRRSLAVSGNDKGYTLLRGCNPLLDQAMDFFQQTGPAELSSKNLEELLAETPGPAPAHAC